MELTTAPATTIISVAEAKEHLRILDTSHDDIISDYIDAAQVMLLHEASILPQSGVVKFYTNDWEDIILDVFKIASVVVKYYDTDNAEQTLGTGNYKFYANAYPYSLEVTTQPSLYDRPDAVTVECTTTNLTDPLIKQAVKMIVADLFENRQTNVTGTVTSMLSRATQFQISLISKRLEV